MNAIIYMLFLIFHNNCFICTIDFFLHNWGKFLLLQSYQASRFFHLQEQPEAKLNNTGKSLHLAFSSLCIMSDCIFVLY